MTECLAVWADDYHFNGGAFAGVTPVNPMWRIGVKPLVKQVTDKYAPRGTHARAGCVALAGVCHGTL